MLHDEQCGYTNIATSHFKYPFFYQDSKFTFFINPDKRLINSNTEALNYHFHIFYHSGVNMLIEELSSKGIDGLLNRDLQLTKGISLSNHNILTGYINFVYNNAAPVSAYGAFNFETFGAYSQYNWELFFHAPLYIACKLSQNRKYEEAMHWFHYIFNPTDKSKDPVPKKFWVTKPFYQKTDKDNWEQQMVGLLKDARDQSGTIAQWLNDPYNPHSVARTRHTAFGKTVVMKYIDNLISWADQLFRQDTMESNNEAALLYVLAYEILGKRPVTLPDNTILVDVQKNYDQAKAEGGIYKFLDEYGKNIPNQGGGGRGTGTGTGGTNVPNISNPEFTNPG
jgi:hypothetical protein